MADTKKILVSEYKNRKIVIDVRITNPTITDITDAKLHLSVAESEEKTDTDAKITKKSANNGGSDTQALVVSGPGLLCRFFIDAADTLTLTAQRYVIDALIVLPGETDPEQLFDVGYFDLKEPVTLEENP
jgi:hypothetical protein